MNTIILIGNLGQDPELSFIPGGKAKVKFSVADTREINGVKEITWHRCIAWGKTAENIASIFTKGQRVLITGRYKVDEYTGKDGVKKSNMELVVDDCGQSIRFDIPTDTRGKFSSNSAPQSLPGFDAEEPF